METVICESCKKQGKTKRATQRHHMFHNKVLHKKLYPEYINDLRNFEPACDDCHISHVSIYLTHWNEKKFCEVMEIKTRSKTGELR